MRLALLALILVPSLMADAPPDFQWTGYVPPDQAVEIQTINGNIRVELTDRPDVEVAVFKTGSRPDPATVPIEMTFYEGGVVFCAVYPSSNPARPNRCTPGGGNNSVTLTDSDLRIDFIVRVPAGVAARLRTVNGSIEANVPPNAVDAAAVNGRMTITARDAKAVLVNGSILASLGNAAWTGSRDLATVNGSIDVEVLASANVSVNAHTLRGTITTDFPIAVRTNFIGVSLDGVIGTGEAALRMNTVNGSVHLRSSTPPDNVQN